MKKHIFLILAIILLLVSCKSVEVRTEYVPIELDYEELIQPVLDLKPAEPQLIDAPADLSDIMQNSVSFQYAYENWKNYALALEQFYKSLVNKQEVLVSTT